MADRVHVTDYTRGPVCPLCGRAYAPGHNRKERILLRDNDFRSYMTLVLGVVINGDR
jgi:hypothetical protein